MDKYLIWKLTPSKHQLRVLALVPFCENKNQINQRENEKTDSYCEKNKT